MPTPYVHLPLAHDVAHALHLTAESLPSFMFGSIAPDVAQVFGRPRASTHFWTADDDVSGTVKLLAALPALRASRLSPLDQAFMAGYLCHLVADEQWTLVIWRRYFGRYSPYGGGPEGAALQSAFRDALEEQAYVGSPSTRDLAHLLARASTRSLSPSLLTCFSAVIDPSDLEHNREQIVVGADFASGAERLRNWASAGLPGLQHATHSTDAARAQALRYVQPESIAAFKQRSLDASLAVLDDYLQDRPIRPPLGTATPTTDRDRDSPPHVREGSPKP
ncbi:MAG TPA: zinc dependent phospholipase C family protein [Chloroflexota bacterium]|nr:zinc dependent phospholipase C family protein [Chloroflexota bacterium]